MNISRFLLRSNTSKQLIGRGGAVKGLRDRPFARVSTECIWSAAITRNVLQERSRELRRASSAQITNTVVVVVVVVATATTTTTTTAKHTYFYIQIFLVRVVRSFASREAAE